MSVEQQVTSPSDLTTEEQKRAKRSKAQIPGTSVFSFKASKSTPSRSKRSSLLNQHQPGPATTPSYSQGYYPIAYPPLTAQNASTPNAPQEVTDSPTQESILSRTQEPQPLQPKSNNNGNTVFTQEVWFFIIHLIETDDVVANVETQSDPEQLSIAVGKAIADYKNLYNELLVKFPKSFQDKKPISLRDAIVRMRKKTELVMKILSFDDEISTGQYDYDKKALSLSSERQTWARQEFGKEFEDYVIFDISHVVRFGELVGTIPSSFLTGTFVDNLSHDDITTSTGVDEEEEKVQQKVKQTVQHKVKPITQQKVQHKVHRVSPTSTTDLNDVIKRSEESVFQKLMDSGFPALKSKLAKKVVISVRRRDAIKEDDLKLFLSDGDISTNVIDELAVLDRTDDDDILIAEGIIHNYLKRKRDQTEDK